MSNEDDYDRDHYDDEDYFDDGIDDSIEQVCPDQDLNKNIDQGKFDPRKKMEAYENIKFINKDGLIDTIIESIEFVMEQQDISCGRALFLLRNCRYNVNQTQSILTDIIEDIFYSETKESNEAKNLQKCLKCEQEFESKAFSLQCNHNYCLKCTEEYIGQQLKGGEKDKICCKCQFPSCKERFGHLDFEIILEQQLYKAYQGLIENDALANSDYVLNLQTLQIRILLILINIIVSSKLKRF